MTNTDILPPQYNDVVNAGLIAIDAFDALKELYERDNAKVGTLMAQRVELAKEYDKKHAALMAADKNVRDVNFKCDKAEKEKEGLEKKVACADRVTKKLQREVNKQVARAEVLNEKYDEAKLSAHYLSEEKRRLNRELSDVKTELRGAKESIDHVLDASAVLVENKNDKINDLQADYAATNGHVNRLEQGYNAVRQRYRAVQGRNDRLKTAVATLNTELADKYDDVRSLEYTLAQRNAHINSLGHTVQGTPARVVYAAVKDAYARFTTGSDAEVNDCARSTARAIARTTFTADSAVALVAALAGYSAAGKILSNVPVFAGLLKAKYCYDVYSALQKVIAGARNRPLNELVSRITVKAKSGWIPSEIAACYA